MKVAIIIVNYNKKELALRCLRSLQKNDYNDFQIIVVDNGSNDGSISLIKEEFPGIILLEMGYNAGFCKANNVGIRKGLEIGSDAILLLNNDTEVNFDFLTKMVGGIDDKNKIGMVAPKINFLTKRDVIDSCGLLITPDGLAKNRGLELCSIEFSALSEVFCPAGAAALYTKKLLEEIEENGQYLDEKFEYYFEELDLGWRARLLGWKCAYVPDSIVYHLKSATSGAYSEFIAFYTNRNIFYNIIKNYPIRFAIKALALSLLRYGFLLRGIFTGKGPAEKIQKNIGFLKLVKVCFLGWIDVLKNVKVLLIERRNIQKSKKVSNAEIDRWFSELGLSFLDSLYK